MISKNTVKLVRSLELKKNRRREGLFVAEGPKAVGDLMRCEAPQAVFATREWMEANGGCGGQVTEVSGEELRRLSFLQHPQQVVALFRTPPETAAPETVDGLMLALDGVRDPGNMGTIIRIADWFGISTIVCSGDTADAYNPKVVQATMGSIARVRVVGIDDLAATLRRYRDTGVPVYGTLLDGADIYGAELAGRGVVVMGNEGKGISPEVRSVLTDGLLIPHFSSGDTAESLNVAIATAIVCSEFRRRAR